MKTIAAQICFWVLTFAATAVIAAEPSAPVSKATTDQQTAAGTFIRKAAQDGMLEVETGKLALSKTTNADIKRFAQQMITDHGNANIELQRVAGPQYQVPTQLDADHQAKLELLMSKSGSEFDRAYGTEAIQDHKNAIKLFTDTANDNNLTPELRQFARKTLPTLQQHQAHALQLPADPVKQ
jgi:putative membrane protein